MQILQVLLRVLHGCGPTSNAWQQFSVSWLCDAGWLFLKSAQTLLQVFNAKQIQDKASLTRQQSCVVSRENLKHGGDSVIHLIRLIDRLSNTQGCSESPFVGGQQCVDSRDEDMARVLHCVQLVPFKRPPRLFRPTCQHEILFGCKGVFNPEGISRQRMLVLDGVKGS